MFTEGDSGEVMYVVLEGVVEIQLHGKPIEVVGPGGVVGEMALIDEWPRSASLMAMTGCRLAVVDEAQFLALLRREPAFALQVMRVLVDRLRRTHVLV